MRRSRRSRCVRDPDCGGRAFALIDVIVAAVLLGVALAVMIGVMGSAVAAQRRGIELQTAAMLADEQLSLVLARGPDGYTRAFPADGRCEPPFADYSYTLEILPQGGSDPYLVRATIRWMSGSRPASLSIETLIAPREGDDPDPDRRPPAAVERRT